MSIESISYAFKAASSLFNDKPHYASVRRRPILFEIAKSPPVEPLQREPYLLDKFISTAYPYLELNKAVRRVQYWNGLPYNYSDAFGTSIQFLDQNNTPLPPTSIPPPEDLGNFINRVQENQGPVPVDEQFKILLDISNGNITGAANLGMLATRYMSRFSEFKAYPRLNIFGKCVTEFTDDEEINELMHLWSSKMPRFELYNEKSDRNDGTGDQYYFWTHFFAAFLYNQNTVKGQLMQTVFSNGNQIMIYVKNKLAKRGTTVSDHFEASLLGRHIGLALNTLINEGSRDLQSPLDIH